MQGWYLQHHFHAIRRVVGVSHESVTNWGKSLHHLLQKKRQTMEVDGTVSPPQADGRNNIDGDGDDNDMDLSDGEGEDVIVADDGIDQSLIIPIKSGSKPGQFIEIFSEEMIDTPSSTLLQVLQDEDADLSVWADAALYYIQHKSQAQAAAQILDAGCERAEQRDGSKDERVRINTAAGISHLTEAADLRIGGAQDQERKVELEQKADNRFTFSSKVDNFYPMTLMGKGMLNLSTGRLDQARFFFDTTVQTCGKVLPALLGLAAVAYQESNYKLAQELYGEAMKRYPTKSGAAARIGFGLACYRLGQVR